MTKDELIAKQQLEIETLKEDIKAYEDADKAIYKVLYSIGGPLNDNKLGYTKEQLAPFFRITEQLR